MMNLFKLNLKYTSFKEDCYYFIVNNPDVLTAEYKEYETDGQYYPFFKGSNGDMILKIKGKYITELDNKIAPFYASVHLKDFKLMDKNKKMKLGLYVDSVILYD